MPSVSDLIGQVPIALGPKWIDPDFLIETFGFIGVLAIVFVETGLLVGFFLPGDSLLFTAGLLSANDVLPDIWVLVLLIPVASIAGNQLGYVIGRKAGPAIFSRPRSRFFRQEYVEKAHDFFERYGPRTIVLAQFVPIVRTITPVMAGVSRMRYRTFLAYNVVGAILWGSGVTTLGYFLGQIEFVKSNIEYIIIGIVALSVIPIALELLKARKRGGATGLSPQEQHELEVAVGAADEPPPPSAVAATADEPGSAGSRAAGRSNPSG